MPLQHTQAGVLEHKQIYLTDMPAHDHAECKEIIRRLRGSHSTNLTRYVTHVVVSSGCQDQEKIEILQHLEECAGSLFVVWPGWLRACDKVCIPLSHAVSVCRTSVSSS